jgi:hypothetical protein
MSTDSKTPAPGGLADVAAHGGAVPDDQAEHRAAPEKHLCRGGTSEGFSGKGFLYYCRRREELRDPFLQSRCHHFRGLPGEKRGGHPLPYLSHPAAAGIHREGFYPRRRAVEESGSAVRLFR